LLSPYCHIHFRLSFFILSFSFNFFVYLAGEILALCQPFLEKEVHPIVLIGGLRQALRDAQFFMRELAVPLDVQDNAAMRTLVRSALHTKFSGRYGDLLVELALRAVRMVAVPGVVGGQPEVDIKRFVRVEKIPGDTLEASHVLEGILLNKDVTHPAMRRRIENPRIVLLDCSLEYKKGESQTSLELGRQSDWQRVLAVEEEQVRALCAPIIALRPDLVITEKGVSDLAQHVFQQNNITALRRVKKLDNMRLSRATGASIVSRPEDLKESDVGTRCALFHVEQIGDEAFSFLAPCSSPQACTVVLRGASKDVLNELERDLQDALCVARNLYLLPQCVPGGGALEMALAVRLARSSRAMVLADDAPFVGPYRILADALQIIPRTLIANCGADVIRTLTDLSAKHAASLEQLSKSDKTVPDSKESEALKTAAVESLGMPMDAAWGVDGLTGAIVNMAACRSGGKVPAPKGMSEGIWEPLAVKLQTLKTAVEAACMLLRVDDIVSGMSKKSAPPSDAQSNAPPAEEPQQE
jgi:T-complex protein 1 subunit gamma